MRRIVCLGIESTADDFGVGIATSEGEILANVKDTYVSEGIHPREAAQHHSKVAVRVVREALEMAGIELKDVDVIAFSQGPGMGPCLRTGATVARALAAYLNVPLTGVNHCLAHIEIGRLTTGLEDPVVLYVSAGNTIVSAFAGGRYRVFGETLDIAVGNCIDVFAREAGIKRREDKCLGAIVEELAKKGKNFVELPYVVKGMDLSFSGLLTAALKAVQEHPIEDVCYSLQEVAFSMLTEVTERALVHTKKREVLLTGGVAANKRLQEMLKEMAEEHEAKFDVVKTEYATDNGAMIAWTGCLNYLHGITVPIEESYVRRKWRLDEVDVPWRK